MKAFLFVLLILGSAFLSLSPVRAVIVAGGTGSQNSTSTGAGAGWDYVGSIQSGSAVYLGTYNGEYWMLSAAHLGISNGSSVVLPSGVFNYVDNSLVRLTNQDNSLTDLVVFRINGNPGLSNLALTSTSLSNGSSITAIGYGSNRATSTTTWFVDTSTNPYTWSESFFAGANTTATGYKYAAGNVERWGTNTIDGSTVINDGFGNVHMLDFDFSNTSGEAVVATGDSGGGTFYNAGTVSSPIWELAGINLAVGTFSGQPSSTAVFGDLSYVADMSYYNNIILSAVPEPSVDALVLLGSFVVGLRLLRGRNNR